MHEDGHAAMSRRPEMARWTVGALRREPGEARRILGVEDADGATLAEDVTARVPLSL